MGSTPIKTCQSDIIFGVFSACSGDTLTLILDLRPQKPFEKSHILHSFCVRVSSNAAVLLDYSKHSYNHQNWTEGCWWDRHIILYGPAGLKKDHPVATFLSNDGHCKSISIYPDGFEAFSTAYPFLCTSAVKTNTAKKYPSLLEDNLYLGDWSHAEAGDRLKDLNIGGVISIHNNPERMKLPSSIKHLRIELADVESADIGAHLLAAHDFIEVTRAAGKGILVHCGAGVSRSAALCISHLMRKHRWSAHKALDYVKTRRSIVQPNDGFWRTLCRLETQLGIADRSNPNEFTGVHGLDWHAPVDLEEAKVHVAFIPTNQDAVGEDGHGRKQEKGREVQRSRSRSTERKRDRKDRSRSRSQPRGRQRRDSPDRNRKYRSRSRIRSRSLSRDRYRRDRGRKEDRSPRPSSKREGREPKSPPSNVVVDKDSEAVLEVSKDGQPLGKLVMDVSRPSQECIFGRLPSCQVPLDHLSISRQHAKVHSDGAGHLFITDLGSGHGTNVDGVWIRANVPKQIGIGSRFKLGASMREYKVVKLPKSHVGEI